MIGEKLCPFAPPLQTNPDLLRVICAGSNTDREQAIKLVKREAQQLVGKEVRHELTLKLHETTLVILDVPDWSRDFREFIRFSWDLQEQVVEQQNLFGSLQLVLFHPLATHQTYGTEAQASAGDFTIRSPYPTVHLLREVDVLRAVEGGYPNLESLPARNQAKLMQKGIRACQERLETCYQVDKQ